MNKKHFFVASWMIAALPSVTSAIALEKPYGHSASSLAYIDAKLTLGRQSLMMDPNRALGLANEAKRAAESLPRSDQRTLKLTRADWLAGAALINSNRAVDAAPLLRRALHNGNSLRGEPKLLGDLNSSLAIADGLVGHTEDAVYGLQRAYRYFVIAHEAPSQARVLQNIGAMYLNARDFDQALKYFDQAGATYPGDALAQASLLIVRGGALKEQGKSHDAERTFEQAVALATSIKSSVLEAMALTNLAVTQLAANDVDGAEKSIRRGLSVVASDASARTRLPPLYAVQAEAALRRGQIGRATQLIERAFATVGPAASKTLLREFEKTAYEIYKAKGDEAKALTHLERFKQLDDQARALAASTSAALLSARFYSANQDASIAQLRQIKAEQEATIQRNQVVFQRRLLAGAAAIVILLMFGFLSIRRSRNQVRAANDELTGTNHELERALAARTEFLATTSHEIRTPLNGILGMTQVILAERGLAPGIKDKIELVQGAGETMKALVDDILDVAKIANGELTIHPAEMDLQRLLREAGRVWEAQATTKAVAIEINTADAPDRIVEDEVRLRQIVFNLMANAVKFTDRGMVRLSARLIPDHAEPGANGILRIAITDTGIGIPADRLDDIFESFRQVDGGTTRRHGGTGLGLAICRNLARAMGGDVSVTSVLGGGSTFTVELPCRPVARAVARVKSGVLGDAGVLLVEANPLARSMLAAVLAPHVGRLIPSGEAEEAMILLEGETVEIVLADGAALGLDMGVAAQLATAAERVGAVTVLLWPSPDGAILSAAKSAGVANVIAKPISAQDLVVALKDFCMTERSPEEIAA